MIANTHQCPRCKQADFYSGRVCAFREDGTFIPRDHHYCMSMTILREMGEDFPVEPGSPDHSGQYCQVFPVGDGKYVLLGFYSSKPTEVAMLLDGAVCRPLVLSDIDPAIQYIEAFWADKTTTRDMVTLTHPIFRRVVATGVIDGVESPLVLESPKGGIEP